MAITLKRNGRPTKASKELVKRINNFLSNLNDKDRANYSFKNEIITSESRLNEIWSEIIKPNEPLIKENQFLDRSTGEIIDREEIKENIKEKTQEQANFVNNNDTMEDATIIDEINEGGNSNQMDDVPSFFNPLQEPIKQRSYNKAQQTNVGDIPEPDFTKNESAQERLESIEQESDSFEEVVEEEEEQQEKEWDNVTNDSMNELDEKDKKLAAKQLVQTVLDGYEMLHELGKNYVKYPEEELREKVIKGEIDPTMEIPLDENGTTTNPIEFFQDFNKQAEEAITYDPEFGEKVRPAMERVFAKKGWGMTDEQFLLVAFGKDAAWKTVQIMTLKKTAKGFMDTFVQLQTDKNNAIREQRKREMTAERPISPDAIVTPPRREPVYQEPVQEEIYEEEYVDAVQDYDEETGSDIVPIH
jgi:hypothetical protein